MNVFDFHQRHDVKADPETEGLGTLAIGAANVAILKDGIKRVVNML